MNPSEIKEFIIGSLDPDTDTGKYPDELEREGVIYDFSKGFREAVLDRVFPVAIKVRQEIEFVRSLNIAFKGIAISGIAAIVVLLISIFFMEGSISINSFLGLKDNYDESIICLLTGK